MMLSLSRVVLVAACLTLLGCSATVSPVKDITHARVSAAMPERSMDNVKKAIIRGLATKRWTIEENEPGLLVASVSVGPHYAQIKITYDADTYSIAHADSSPSLRYDGETIHRRYNHWIRLLNEAIQSQMAVQPLRARIITDDEAAPR